MIDSDHASKQPLLVDNICREEKFHMLPRYTYHNTSLRPTPSGVRARKHHTSDSGVILSSTLSCLLLRLKKATKILMTGFLYV